MTGEASACPHCGVHLQVSVFPAILRSKVGGVPEALGSETEASCFYHAQNRAVKPCDECGRFLCSLCELEVSGRIFCPGCFASNLRGRKIQDLENSRTMHDAIALSLATVPAMLFWPVVVTAPMALYWAIRHWNSPRSVVPRTRVRFYFAILIALAEISAVALMVFGVFYVVRNK
jgi:hypothetical protein